MQSLVATQYRNRQTIWGPQFRCHNKWSREDLFPESREDSDETHPAAIARDSLWCSAIDSRSIVNQHAQHTEFLTASRSALCASLCQVVEQVQGVLILLEQGDLSVLHAEEVVIEVVIESAVRRVEYVRFGFHGDSIFFRRQSQYIHA